MKYIVFSVLYFCSSQTFCLEPELNKFLYGSKLEDEVLKVLTGVDSFDGLKIIERGSLDQRMRVRNYLTLQLKILGYSPLVQDYRSTGANIFAILEATISTKEYVVIGAHYDSVHNAGANDNATGVAIVMSMAKKLSQTPLRNKNVLFCFFDEEELGRQGSQHFAQKLKKEKWQIHSVHTIDQMGYDSDGDLAIELEKAPQDLFSFYQKINNDGGYNLLLLNSPVDSTNHKSFSHLGFKAMGLTEEYFHNDTTPCYHDQCDTYETVNMGYLLSTSNYWTEVIRALIML